jgi:Gluconate 2-dehydrogenase subunit 3
MLDNRTGAGAGLTRRELTNRELTNRELTRRELIRRLVNGAGAGVVLAGTAAAHPIYKHLTDGALLAQADAHIPAGAWTPKSLDAHQNETLLLLAERLVPNSGKAQVNRFIDLLLSVDTAETRQRFSQSLAVFDRESTSRFGHAFKDIPEATQDELLSAFSAATPSLERKRSGRRHSEQDAHPEKPAAENHLTLRDHFENLKTWVTGAYYSSEIGMRELGWTGTYFFTDFPGCEHPDGHS